MATTVRVSRWDDATWDDLGLNVSQILVNDTFTVSNIDTNNRVVALAPASTSYTKNLTADSWDNATYWWDATLASHFTNGQTFTVQSIDVNNRILVLTG